MRQTKRLRSWNSLRRSAAHATKFRGHKMRWTTPFKRESDGKEVVIGKCTTCGLEVRLMQRPSPNEIDIGGEAVALTCDVHRECKLTIHRLEQQVAALQRQAEERKPRELSNVERAKKVAEDLCNFVNSYSNRTSVDAFVEAMSCQHRTLQQAATHVMLAWFAHLSSLNENYYDLRNAHAVKVAKMIRDRMFDEYGSSWTHMPCI